MTTTDNKWSEHFTRHEVEFSATAVRAGIDNKIPPEQETFWKRAVIEGLEPLRQLVSVPLIISSGYRSPRLNVLIKGNSNSMHLGCYYDRPTHNWLSAAAFDLKCPQGGNLHLWRVLMVVIVELRQTGGVTSMLAPDQVIYEYQDPSALDNPAWVHVGFVNYRKGRKPRAQVLRTRKVKDESGDERTTTEIYTV